MSYQKRSGGSLVNIVNSLYAMCFNIYKHCYHINTYSTLSRIDTAFAIIFKISLYALPSYDCG